MKTLLSFVASLLGEALTRLLDSWKDEAARRREEVYISERAAKVSTEALNAEARKIEEKWLENAREHRTVDSATADFLERVRPDGGSEAD